MKDRPSTEGCTELSCMYHGGDNRFKSAHGLSCPIREYDGWVMVAFDDPNALITSGVKCNCNARRK